MATAIGQGRPFRIGRVFNASLSVIGSNPAIVGFATVTLGIVTVGLTRILGPLPHMLAERMIKGDPTAWATYIPDLLFEFMVSSFVISALTQATVEELSDRSANLRLCLKIGARMVVPVTAISLITFVAMILGIVLLIVPGMIVVTIWAVAAPAQVVEGRGIIASIARSQHLTKGHRWSVAGLLLISIVVWLPISLLREAVGGSIGPSASMVIESLESSLYTAFSAVLMATTYLELRLIKEGPELIPLTDVFA